MASKIILLMFLRLNLSLLVLGLGILSGCAVGTSNITEEAASAGQRYRTKVDLYLYSLPEREGPYLGINDGKHGNRDLLLPKDVSGQYVGRRHNNAQIIEIVPAGAELFVKKTLRNVSSQGVVVWFVCDLSSNNRRVQNVSTTFIQSNINGRDRRLPEIDSTLAERLK